MKEATKGAQFDPSDRWKCACGAEHEFSGYAVAHWRDELQHTCKGCGTVRLFRSGEVLGVTELMKRGKA